MLSVSLATCLAGRFLCCSPPPFFPAALQRFKDYLLARQIEADLLVTTFHSPALNIGLPISPAGS
jgi:hypothetical protein